MIQARAMRSTTLTPCISLDAVAATITHIPDGFVSMEAAIREMITVG